ncbi:MULTISPECIES: hypothetical protein [Actinomadura]|uniref:Uncharacterized protein n=1 Tax=Actinomadura rudentiformis TaxID=359158 RepID=A0A6H9YWM4_9ACTN|nr:hypothetical protein [Actinomadura rudentiformis]KAB2351647.1 hypothetical protein F8566_05335 [Actinomadura rudentiformis]
MNPLNDPTVAYLRALLGARVEKARAETDRGASAIEWAIITALLAGIAIAVGAIIIKKVSDKANSINTG